MAADEDPLYDENKKKKFQMIWRGNMIGLEYKGNRWGVVLGYNNFLLTIYVVLMLYY